MGRKEPEVGRLSDGDAYAKADHGQHPLIYSPACCTADADRAVRTALTERTKRPGEDVVHKYLVE